ncbi:MAG: Rrf2 family transcriptional regulator [Fimbriimonadaceae bacterium]|nr:Rrf2 family transcriptional regulator [Fimbriimonadaceae bacterium]
MLSRTMEYALRAMVFLAERPGQNHPVQAISLETQVPPDYLSKVMRDLGRAGLVRSRPGRRGGYELGRTDLAATSLLDVVSAVEPLDTVERCPLSKECHAVELCPLHRAVRSATLDFVDGLRGVTLASLVAVGASSERDPVASGGIARALALGATR